MTKVIDNNVATGKIIQREMNDQELAQWEADRVEANSKAQLNAEIANAKAALLEKLGISEEEAKLLLS